jgi:hypothetical protein
MHVYVCPKCQAICTSLEWNAKAGKCKQCSGNKHNAKRVTVDGIAYASQAEANRHQELLQRERAGEIRDIELQPKYRIYLNGVYICTYIADYRYVVIADGRVVIEDVKSPSTRTAVYKLKKKLVEAQYGISIQEIE